MDNKLSNFLYGKLEKKDADYIIGLISNLEEAVIISKRLGRKAEKAKALGVMEGLVAGLNVEERYASDQTNRMDEIKNENASSRSLYESWCSRRNALREARKKAKAAIKAYREGK